MEKHSVEYCVNIAFISSCGGTVATECPNLQFVACLY